MLPGVRTLTEFEPWARNRGLEIVLFVTGAILLGRLVTWLGGKITDRIDASIKEPDALVRSEASKHRHALAQVITRATVVAIYCAAAVAVAARLGVPVTSLVAPAAVAAVALGFGAQRIVQDILAGFFIITERQYGFGDLIRLSVPGLPSPAIGTVEDVTLRVTTVRTADGEVVITPNGQISQVTNLSRDWARAVVDVPVPAGADVNRVSDLLRLIGAQAYEEPDLRKLLLDPPAVMGVQSIDVDRFQVRLVVRTLPGKQFDVGRALRARIAAGLLREGIHLPTGLGTAEFDRDHLMRRVRISTWLLAAVFLGTLVIYVLVKLPSMPAAGATPAAPATVQPTSSPQPASTTAAPRARTTPRPTRLTAPPSRVSSTRTPHPTGTPTASPSPAGTPVPSATSAASP